MKSFVIIVLLLVIIGAGGYFAYDIYYKPRQIEAQRVAEPEATPPPVPVDPSLGEFEKVMKLRDAGSSVELRDAIRTFIQSYPESTKMADAVDALGEVNMNLLFSTTPTPGKSEYVVASGDTLVKIASKTGTTAEMIMRMNNLETTLLRIGDRLMLPLNKFSLRIHPASKVVDLYDGGQFFKRYKALAVNLPASAGATTVTEKIAWRDGARVAFGSKEFIGSVRWIMLGLPGAALYPKQEEGGVVAGVSTPGRGVELTADAIDELHTILPNKTEVTISN